MNDLIFKSIVLALEEALEKMESERSYEMKKAWEDGSIYCDMFNDGYIYGIRVCYEVLKSYVEC